MTLTIQTRPSPALTITRASTSAKELVYVVVANKQIPYPNGRSRIVYIGTTKNGADRIAQSAAAKANEMLGLHGVRRLELYVVTCNSIGSVKTWHKLERGLLLSFKDIFGVVPQCNIVGKKMKWTDELHYFTAHRLGKIIEKYSCMPVDAK